MKESASTVGKGNVQVIGPSPLWHICVFLIMLSNQVTAQKDSYSTWEALYREGYAHYERNRWDSAEYFLQKAFEVGEEVFTNKDWQKSLTAYYLAGVFYAKGKWLESEEMYLLDLKIQVHSGAELSPNYGVSANDLATLYHETGQYEKAIIYYDMSLKNSVINFGENSMEYATTCNNMASTYEKNGRYGQALELYNTAISLTEKLLGTDNISYAMYSGNLAGLFKKLGRYDKALEIYNDVLKTELKHLGPKHSSYGITLNDIGSVYMYMGNYEKAESLIKEALDISVHNLKTMPQVYNNRLNNLGECYHHQGRLTEALVYYKKGLDNTVELYGKHHPSYGVSLNNLASLYQSSREYELAMSLLGEALENTKQTLGSNNLEYLSTLTNLARLNRETGNEEKAIDLYLEAQELTWKLITNLFTFSVESDQKLFIEYFDSDFDEWQEYGLNTTPTNFEILESNLNNCLQRKGLLLRYYRDIIIDLSNSGNKKADSLIRSIRITKQYRIRLKNRIEPNESLKHELDSLTELQESLELELNRIYNDKSTTKSIVAPTWSSTISKSDDKEAYVEFSRYYSSENQANEYVYVAYLYGKKWSNPIVLKLFQESELTKSKIIQNNNRGASSTGFHYNLIQLYPLIWEPLETYLEGIEKIHFSADGLLNLLPLTSLKDKTGKLISEKFNMVQMASTGTIVEDDNSITPDDILLIGGIEYNYDSTAANKKNKISISYLDATTLRRSASNFQTNTSWRFLEGTREEVESIGGLFETHQKQSRIWDASIASEQRFKQLSGNGPKILHIATHGFFFENRERDLKNNLQSQFKSADDPLIRSGLVLAGGNYAWQNGSNPYEEEDGILTALEISNLDLTDTELVVLSACETGLGRIDSSEGVYGLQRAFRMAGVNHIIMSLWEIPDKETAEFMKLFYSLWLGGSELVEAFNTTQKEMSTRYLNEPEKWAGFILVN